MSGALPGVDEVHADILAVPPEVLAWLRRCERGILDTQAQLQTIVGEPINALAEAREDYRSLLEDQSSLFRRTLHLPVGQLRKGSPARARLDQLIVDLQARARVAMEVQAAVGALHQRVQELRRYSERLPHFTARLLHEHRLEAGFVNRLRRPGEISAALNRVTYVDLTLSELLSAVEEYPDEPADVDPISPELTNDELRALYGVQAQRRSLIQHDSFTSGTLRRTFVGHLRSLDAANHEQRGEADAESLVLSQLFRRSMQDDAAGIPSDQVAALAALCRPAQHLPAMPEAPVLEAPTDVAENTLFVLTIGEGHVHIDRQVATGVRVWTAGIRPNAVMECLPVPIFRNGFDRATADADVAPLFDGIQEGPTSWYKTRRRLRIRVLGRDANGWFGKVESRGVVEVVPGNPWSATHTDPTVFRLAGTTTSLATGDGEPMLASRGGVLWEFLDVRAEVARIPVPGFERAIRKVPATRAKELAEGIEAERRLFEALARRPNPSLLPNGLLPIGTAIVEGTTVARPVYLMPDALTRQECPPVEAWLRSGLLLRMAALRAVARVLTAAHEVGYSLGVLHLDAIAFGIADIAMDGTARPGAMLTSAPWAVLLGTPFAASSHAEIGVRYDHLGLRYAPTAVQCGKASTKEDDAAAFALLMLDVLASNARIGNEITWTTPGDPIVEPSTEFMLPTLSLSIIQAVSSGRAGATRLLAMIAMLAGREPLREVDLVEALGQ